MGKVCSPQVGVKAVSHSQNLSPPCHGRTHLNTLTFTSVCRSFRHPPTPQLRVPGGHGEPASGHLGHQVLEGEAQAVVCRALLSHGLVRRISIQFTCESKTSNTGIRVRGNLLGPAWQGLPKAFPALGVPPTAGPILKYLPWGRSEVLSPLR